MRQVLRCLQGHEWEPPADVATGASLVCPVCGSPDRTQVLSDATRTPSLGGPSDGVMVPPLLRDYEILEEIGRGGMGVVYKARQKGCSRLVALKVIRKDRLTEEQAVARFRREARAAARLSHPNIVLLFDSDQEGDTHYLAMEYVPGVTLTDVVEREGPLPVALACDYMRQAALGLQHAHEQGLIHRDIKPSNLMVTGPEKAPRKVVKILDMGVARLHQLGPHEEVSLTTLTQHGAVIGTPDFVAPEQLEDPHTADVRADLYSLGCTFYYLLGGRVPFPGGTLIQKLDRQRWEVPPSVDQLRTEVPGAVAALVRRLMAKRPADRPALPGELAGALEGLARVGHFAAPAHVAALAPAGRWPAHPGGVLALAFLPDGRLVSAGRDRAVRLWEANREVRSQSFAQDPTALAVSPDGTQVLAAVGVGLRLLEAATLRELQRYTGHTSAVRGVAFAPDGRRAVSGGDDRVLRLWDLEGRGVERLTGHGAGVAGVAWSPDGVTVFSAGREPSLRRWDLGGRREVREFTVPRGPVLGVACCADNLHVLTAHYDRTLRLWDRDSGREMRRLSGHTQMVAALACSADGALVASGGPDRTVRVWDPDSGAEEGRGDAPAPVSCVAFAPSGGLLAAGTAAGDLLVWRVTAS